LGGPKNGEQPTPVRLSVRGLLVSVAFVGIALALMRFLRPMDSETAIRIASQHAKKVYVGIDLEQYSVSAPRRSDWFEEWLITFSHKSGAAGFSITVAGGDLYNGSDHRVRVDNEWGPRHLRRK